MKRIAPVIAALLIASLAVFGLVGCGSSSEDTSSSSETETVDTPTDEGESEEATSDDADDTADADADADLSSYTKAVVKVKGYSSFVIKLDSKDAPTTVEYFKKLVNQGFYNGLTFHRIIAGFCLQGGDPNGDGTGGYSEAVKGEFSSNGMTNALADNFVEGVVAMARATDPDSGDGQFFVTLDTNDNISQSLNGQYAAFGTIGEAGMVTVQQIVTDATQYVTDSNGTVPAENQPVIESITLK